MICGRCCCAIIIGRCLLKERMRRMRSGKGVGAVNAMRMHLHGKGGKSKLVDLSTLGWNLKQAIEPSCVANIAFRSKSLKETKRRSSSERQQ